MEVKNENLLKVEKFFKLNLRIKKLLNDIVPNELDFYDEETMYKYYEKLSNGVEQIKKDMNEMMGIYNINISDSFQTYANDLLKKINSKEFQILMARGYSSILDFYNINIGSMRPEFVDSVNKGFIGYYCFYGDGVMNPNTMNEYLHYTHSHMINSTYFYNSVPIINTTKKKADDWNGISLRGKETELGKELFERILDFNIDSDCIDIINLDNKIVIMARDLGHAAVIEIDTRDLENIFVKYFIPKNTNMEKAQKLRGIKTCNSRFMTGDFMTNKEELSVDLCEFMNTIPTDRDIIRNVNTI